MESFDVAEARTVPRPRRSFDMVWNVLTVTALVVTLCVGAVFLLIFLNPTSGMNPFPPPTLIPLPELPTATSTLRFALQPSWTPTVESFEPEEPTETPRPTNTPLVSATPIGGIPPAATATPLGPTATPAGFAFALQAGSPVAITSLAFHPDAGCNWMGVAGQATSLNGEPVRGLFVQLGGMLAGQVFETRLTMTGLAPQYGPGGFEISIADQLIYSNHTLWIQLLDQQNLPLSDRVYFDTFADCEQNLIIIYFQQVR